MWCMPAHILPCVCVLPDVCALVLPAGPCFVQVEGTNAELDRMNELLNRRVLSQKVDIDQLKNKIAEVGGWGKEGRGKP